MTTDSVPAHNERGTFTGNGFTPSLEYVRQAYRSSGGLYQNGALAGGEFERFLAAHDAGVRADQAEKTLNEAIEAMSSYGAYADFRRAEASGDREGLAYHEGLHDAWAAVNELLMRIETVSAAALTPTTNEEATEGFCPDCGRSNERGHFTHCPTAEALKFQGQLVSRATPTTEETEQ